MREAEEGRTQGESFVPGNLFLLENFMKTKGEY